MFQSTITGSADPDVAQAVEDFLDVGAEIRERSARAIKLPEGSPAREAESAQVRELTSLISARAGRIGMTTGELFSLINTTLDLRARRGRGEPARPTARTLLTAVTNAQAAVAQAELEARAAEAKLKTARSALRAAEGAYRAWGGGKLVEHDRPALEDA